MREREEGEKVRRGRRRRTEREELARLCAVQLGARECERLACVRARGQRQCRLPTSSSPSPSCERRAPRARAGRRRDESGRRTHVDDLALDADLLAQLGPSNEPVQRRKGRQPESGGSSHLVRRACCSACTEPVARGERDRDARLTHVGADARHVHALARERERAHRVHERRDQAAVKTLCGELLDGQ